MRRIFVIIIGLAIAIQSFGLAYAEQHCELSFSDNLDFRVLIVADTQDTDHPQQAMLDLLNESLDHGKPDLVVFLGDMIHGPSLHGDESVKQAIDFIVQPVVQRSIPFALVFGNHDNQCGLTNEQQLAIYQSYPGCLAVEGDAMPGCGNYYFIIENPVMPQCPLVLWFLDSGTYAESGRGTYGYVTEEQNEWMLEEYKVLSSKYETPVSYVFQHIPVPQVYDMLLQVPFGTKNAVTCYGPNFLKWYLPNSEYIWDGALGEGPCSSEYDSGEFDTWKKIGVQAAFFGHDHLNSYCGTLDGVDLIATPGMGFYMYGRGDEHGARLITFHADELANWKSQMLYYRDIVSTPLPGLLIASLGVLIQQYLIIGLLVFVFICMLLVLFIRKKRKKKKENAANR